MGELDCVASGMTDNEILEEYPTLSLEGIKAAAGYGAALAREDVFPLDSRAFENSSSTRPGTIGIQLDDRSASRATTVLRVTKGDKPRCQATKKALLPGLAGQRAVSCVGGIGLEPMTPSVSRKCSTRLS